MKARKRFISGFTMQPTTRASTVHPKKEVLMMKRRQVVVFVFFVFCVGFFPSLSAASEKHIRSALLTETSQQSSDHKTEKRQRPQWTAERPFFEDQHGLHFLGSYRGGAHYRLTMRLAKSEAMKELLESIQVKARSEFSSALHGKNIITDDMGQYVTDAVCWVVDNIRVRGIRPRKTYHEQVFDPVSRTYTYHAWVQLEIPRSEYVQAKIAATERIRDRAAREEDTEAKKKAHELLKKLRKGS